MKHSAKAKSSDSTRVKVGQTIIPIYARERGGFEVRYYLAGKARRFERASLADAKDEAMRIALSIENGRAQAGSLSTVDVQSFVHAQQQLHRLGAAAPPLHVALAEYVTAKLLAGDLPLPEAVRSHLRAHPADAFGTNPPVGEMLHRFLASVADTVRNPRHKRGLRCDLNRFAASLPAEAGLVDVDPETIRGYLRALTCGPRRRNNVRNELVTLFRFAKQEGWLPQDRSTAPERVPRVKDDHEISFYAAPQLRRFLEVAARKWIPWMVLGAFAGLRSAEIVGDPEEPMRPRLTWGDFRWEKDYIVVPAMTARKTRRSRRVPLRENLRAWLTPWREARGYLYPKGADQSKETARFAKLGLEWDNNVLRHSYATHRNAEIGNAGQLAEEMGNSIQMVRRHYDAVPRDVEPEDYFGLMPPPGWGARGSPLAG